MNIQLLYNGAIAELEQKCTAITKFLQSQQHSVVQNDLRTAELDLNDDLAANLQSIDMLICAGGDGSVLLCAKMLSSLNIFNVPILALNYGTLGFLTSIDPPQSTELENILMNSVQITADYQDSPDHNAVPGILQRNLIAIAAANFANTKYALNETVLRLVDKAHPGEFAIFYKDEQVEHFLSDGIYIASSSGSTAYNLSMGGPLLLPSNNSFVVSPIAAHRLNNRPLIFGNKDQIEIKFNATRADLAFKQETVLDIDGRSLDNTSDITTLNIKLADHTLPFIEFDQTRFFAKLGVIQSN